MPNADDKIIEALAGGPEVSDTTALLQRVH
jgi:hypothetical protein